MALGLSLRLSSNWSLLFAAGKPVIQSMAIAVAGTREIEINSNSVHYHNLKWDLIRTVNTLINHSIMNGIIFRH